MTDTTTKQSNGRPGVGSDPATEPAVAEEQVENAFLSVVDEGRRRLSRRWLPLAATGLVGGIDLGTGVLALLVVRRATGSVLVGGLAFSVGFIALSYAHSELFTENFLIPLSTVIARQARARMLVRLWAGTLVANLVGGWLFTWLIIKGAPELSKTAITASTHFVDMGTGVQSFCLAVLGGTVITLMTWMQHSTEGATAALAAAVVAGFLLAGAQLFHSIVDSLLMFAAFHTGHAPFGYVTWAKSLGWAVLGNMVGGIGLVTVLRLLQVPHRLKEERENPAMGVPIADKRRADRPATDGL